MATGSSILPGGVFCGVASAKGMQGFIEEGSPMGSLMDNVGKDEEATMDEFWKAKAGMITEENRSFRLLITE